MKNVSKILVLLAVVAIACTTSIDPTPTFKESSGTFTATTSTNTVAAASEDSLSAAITFSWNDPKFSVGLENSKFVAVFCPQGDGFKSFATKSFTKALSGAILGDEINKIALKFGGVIGESISLDVKIIASQANNNENLESNVMTIDVTPFADISISSSSTDVVTAAATANSVGLVLKWGKGFDGYEGTRTYQLQYAAGGTNFASPTSTSITALTKSYSQLDLNNIASGQFGIAIGAKGPIDFRILVTNGDGKVITSNTVTVQVTPYSLPPLFAMGDALNGWGPWPDKEVILYYNIDLKVYQAVAYITTGSKAFRFFKQADWNPTSYNYPYFTTVDANLTNANDGDSNFRFNGTSGYYTITVDMENKTVELGPVLYMMGGALNGWGPWPDASVKLASIGSGVFIGTATFKNDIFRFFAQADWGPTGYSYPYFTTVDANFVLNPSDGDNNLKFVGTPGTYNIKVDLNNKTVNLY